MLRTTRVRRRRKLTALLTVFGMCASLTACGGNRNSEAEVAAAAGVNSTQVTQVPADVAGGTSTTNPGVAPAGDAPGAVSPGTGTTVSGGSNPRTPASARATTAPGTKQTTADTGKTTTGSTGSGQSVPIAKKGPATLSPISIGMVGTFSGPVGALVAGTSVGARVWAKWANDNGGANGHVINLIVADDAGDPARFQSLVKELVEQKGVIAFVQNTLGLAPGGNNEYLNSKRVMTFSNEGGSDVFYKSHYTVTAFPSGETYAQAIIGAVAQEAIRQKHIKVGAVACSDFSICDLFDKTWKDPDYLRSLGLTPAFAARPSLTQPDYTATCLAAKQAGADLLLFGLDSSAIERFASDCARQNYHPMLGTGDIVVNDDLPKAEIVDGIVIGTKIAPWTATNVPGVKTFVDAMARYAPGQQPSGATELGWTAGQFLLAAAKNLPANPTAADFVAGTYRIKGDTLNGVTYPLDFTKAETAPRKLCFGIVVVRDRKFVQGPGPALNCPK